MLTRLERPTMDDDIVTRLRNAPWTVEGHDAADEIEQLRAALYSIRSRHEPIPYGPNGLDTICSECDSQNWPCPTFSRTEPGWPHHAEADRG